MSAIIFWVSLKNKKKLTIIEYRESVWRSEGSLILTYHTNQICLSNQLNKLKRSAKISLMSESKRLCAINFESNGGGKSYKGSILVEADGIDRLFSDFSSAVHNYSK